MPRLFEPPWEGLSPSDFTHPAYAAVFTSVDKAATEPGTGNWVHQVAAAAENDQIRSLVAALAVEPLALTGSADSRYVVANSAKLQLLAAMRAVGQLKSKLQRTNPVDHPTKYNQMFSELVVLEARARQLHTRFLGAED